MTERKIIDVESDSRPDSNSPEGTERMNTTGLRKLVRRLHHASNGGAFPLALAGDAADAIEQLLDVLGGVVAIAHIAGLESRASRIKDALNGMYITSQFGRSVRRSADDLTEAEIARLRLLNQKLAEAEQWILQRRDQSLGDYFRAGGVRDQRYSDELWEDVETEITVQLILRKDHPDYDEEDDNFVAELHWLNGIYDPPTEITNWNEFQFRDGHRLQHEQHCYLFHDLTDHVLGNDWDRVLDIGGIWIDVQLIQQRGVCWR